MPHLVYAMFPSAEVADRVRAELLRDSKDTYDVVPHEHRLDTNHLPESATTYGRNMFVATAIGSVFFMVAGAVVGAYDVVPGMGPGMGLALGLISGVTIGIYTGMQAGTRVAKPPIAALGPRLPQGEVLLTIEVPGREDAEHLLERLDDGEATETGIC